MDKSIGGSSAKAAAEARPFVLALPGCGAELELVPEAGGMLNRLRLSAGGQGIDVVAGMDPQEAVRANPAYRGVPLFPFPNRLADGAFSFRGQRYQFPINETELHNRLHGFLYQMEPEIVETLHGKESAQVSLLYAYDGALPAYPFRADVKMTYRLKPDSLRVDMAVVNRAEQPIPVGIGWHPYYCLGRQKIDRLMLSLPGVEHMPVNNRMLPTGELRAYSEFAALKVIGDTRFDDCYGLVEKADKAQIFLWSPDADLGLEVWQEAGREGFRYLQLCTPPDRQSIAIEPMSCAVDAFNNGRGLTILEPGQEFSGAFGVRLTNRKP